LSQIDQALDKIAQETSSDTRVEIHIDKTANLQPTPMNDQLQNIIECSARSLNIDVIKMPSGAGHDAMFVGKYLPAGMLFIPSIAGLSHDSDEDSSEEDIKIGVQVMGKAVYKIMHELE